MGVIDRLPAVSRTALKRFAIASLIANMFIIVSGGAAVGKSPLMPPSGDLASKPVTLAALRALIRSFAN